MKKLVFIMAIVLMACSGTKDKESEAVSYELMTVELKSDTIMTEYAALVKGNQDIKIIPRIDGYLQEIKVKEGEQVRKGQLLFVIDQVAYRAAVKTAKARVLQAESLLAKAQQDCEGKKMLFQKKVVSDFDMKQTMRDVDIAKANLEAEEAALESAENDLSYTELRSPSDGVIGNIPYRKGDYVGPSMMEGLTVVCDNRQMIVYFSLSEQRAMEYLATYSSMFEAVEHMPALSLLLPGNVMYDEKGRVESISGVVDGSSGAVSVRAVFPNEGGRLLSGSTARVLIPEVYKDAIIIPQEATYEIQDKVYVMKVVEGKATSNLISVERIHNGTHYVVTGGLKKGDQIIAKGAGLVAEGTPVKVK